MKKFADCYHDCLGCSHLDVDCEGDDEYEEWLQDEMDEDGW